LAHCSLSVIRRDETTHEKTAAQSQLGEAIKLFFEMRDPVSIHTLLGAAHQIMRDVAKSNDISYKCVIEELPNEAGLSEKEWYRRVFRPRNFFKHGETDSNVVLDFDPRENDLWLLDACILYGQVFEERFKPVEAFWAWYQCKHPETREFLSVPALTKLATLLNIEHTDYNFFREHCK